MWPWTMLNFGGPDKCCCMRWMLGTGHAELEREHELVRAGEAAVARVHQPVRAAAVGVEKPRAEDDGEPHGPREHRHGDLAAKGIGLARNARFEGRRSSEHSWRKERVESAGVTPK